ncbi:MAG: NAD-dependent epimerase/dehydratase family protein [Candidatus Micrarchaeia archaeon]
MAFQKVLVTGAGGFLGTHLCAKLASQGMQVTAFVQKNQSAPLNTTAFEGDVLNLQDLEKAMQGVDAVFHLAGQTTPKKAQENPQEDFKINVQGTKNALEAAEKNSVDTFLFTSTSYVYGFHGKTPLKESLECSPDKEYGKSKLAAEKLCRLFAQEGKINRAVISRLFNVYGPGQKGRVIPDLIQKARTTQGNSFEVLGNCADFRDFLYVDDAVDALVLLAQKGQNGESYNVANGKSIEVKELAEKIAQATNTSKLPSCAKYDPATSRGMNANNTKLRQLGWSPSTHLEEGLKKCL